MSTEYRNGGDWSPCSLAPHLWRAVGRVDVLLHPGLGPGEVLALRAAQRHAAPHRLAVAPRVVRQVNLLLNPLLKLLDREVRLQ